MFFSGKNATATLKKQTFAVLTAEVVNFDAKRL
jgi:hypothetical protein